MSRLTSTPDGRTPRVKLAAALCAGALLLAGCNDKSEPTALVSPTLSPTASPTPSPTPKPTPQRTVSPTPKPVTTRASPTPSPAPRRTSSPKPIVPTCPRVPSVRGDQVLLVVGSGSSAVIRACQRKGARWVSVMGRMYGHVGLNGVAPAGAKREGDRRTPSGTFSLGTGFGVLGDPGTWFSWHRTTRADVWVDDSGSDYYNTRQEKPAYGRWDSAEDLYVPGTYDYVQVIDYNTARVPGRGSGIFLHVDHHSGTFGCVSLPRSQLLKVFRWEKPGALIVIR